jgi:2-iminobutanoate/2-iminopropanoate deaminase
MASKQVVHTSFFSRPAKYSPFSAGLIVPPGCGLLFTPGMTARDAQGETMYGGDVTAQTRRVLEQLQAVVTEAGATMDDVVKLTVFIMEMSDAVPIQAVRNEFWPTDPPVSSTVQVAALVNEQVRVEIEAITLLQPTAGA